MGLAGLDEKTVITRVVPPRPAALAALALGGLSIDAVERATPPSVVAEPVPAQTSARGGQAAALLAACRPRQWTKNLLVAAVPAASGELTESDVLLATGLVFLAFCLASSAAYLLNDIRDLEADHRHPRKRERPLASGRLSVRLAAATGAMATVLAVGLSLLAGLAAMGALLGYLALTTSYSVFLKHEPVFDIAAVAGGFFIRAVAGGLASGIYISQWFLIVAAGASLFVVAGMRYAEVRAGGSADAPARRVLASYSPEYLRWVLSAAASVTILAYCLWAFEGRGDLDSTWSGVSVVPFILAMMRYGLLLEQGHGEEPEEIFLGDRVLQLLVVAWALVLGIGVLA